MSEPTFYQSIRPLFTQYDRIKMMYYADLWNYQQVKDRAKYILLSLKPKLIDGKPDPAGWSQLPDVHVMPKYTGAWSDENVQLFSQWVDAGCPQGTPPVTPVTPGPQVDMFLALSKALTGFDQLSDKVLAQIYIDRILKESDHAKNDEFYTLLKTFSKQPGILDADGHLTVDYQPYLKLIQDITILWYNTSINDQLGTPDNNQYIQGLVWQAIQAHPMGYADTNEQFYWQYKPEGRKYTGLQTVIPRVLSEYKESNDE